MIESRVKGIMRLLYPIPTDHYEYVMERLLYAHSCLPKEVFLRRMAEYAPMVRVRICLHKCNGITINGLCILDDKMVCADLMPMGRQDGAIGMEVWIEKAKKEEELDRGVW